MTRTFDGPPARPPGQAGNGTAAPNRSSRPTGIERAIVLCGFVAAAVWTALSVAAGTGMESAGALWLAAIAWAVVSSLALALRRGIRDRDWSAFRRHRLPDNRDTLDWSTKTGAYAYMRVAEEHERLMRRD